MEKSRRICHDLKTERPDVGKPLPGFLRIVPLGLYLCTAAFIVGIAWLSWEMHQAKSARQKWKAEEATEKAKQAGLANDLAAIDKEAKRAEDVKKWVDASEPLQPLVLLMAQSLDGEASIAEIKIDRDRDQPKQLRVLFRLNGGGNKQLDKIKGKIITEMGFKTFGESITASKGGAIDWSVTLMKPAGWKPSGGLSMLPPR